MKKNFSLKLVSMAMVAALLAAPGCKDYDDDVKNLRELTAGVKSELETLKTGIGTKIDDVKKAVEAADKAAKEAQAAADKAKEHAAGLVGTAKTEALAAAKAAQDAADKALANLKTLEGRATKLEQDLTALANRVAALESGSMTKEELQREKAKIEEAAKKLFVEVAALVGNRVTSIALLPTHHVNGIAAVTLEGMAYEPQKHNPEHKSFGFATIITEANARVYSEAMGEGLFRLSPSTVSKESFGMPSIELWDSYNYLRSAAELRVNDPVAPTAYELKDNILSVTFKKTTSEVNINQEYVWKNPYGQDPWCEGHGKVNVDHEVEDFLMGALSLPITEKFLSKDEKEKALKPAVISEGFRLAELYTAPVIKSTIAKGEEVGYIDATGANPVKEVTKSHHAPCFKDYHPYAFDNTPSTRHYLPANGAKTLEWGLPTHFSDSTLLYESELNHLVDIDLDWDKTYDLMQYVAVSTRDSHADFDYKKHGLAFHFAIAAAPYKKGPKNQTDQQEFATLKGSMISSKVYTVGGATQTALDREPIIRITLLDTKTKEIVDQRYMKIRWSKQAVIKDLGETRFEDALVSCNTEYIRLNTQKMNEDIYRRVEALGISKASFTDRYTRLEIEHLTKDGEYIVKDGKFVAKGYETATMTSIAESTNTPPYRNLMLYYIPEDQEDPAVPGAVNAGNTSFNVVWGLTPEVIRTIAEGGKSEFVLTFKFVDRLNETHLRYNFKVAVKLPMQEFNYEQTYWTTGKKGTEFKVNPLIYTPDDKTGADARKSAQADYDDVDYNGGFFAHGGTANVKTGDSHIQADLVNGFLYTRGEGNDKVSNKPENLGQFIQYIRKCAKVSFQFDADRFGEEQFKYLADGKFVVSTDGTQLWKGGTVGNAADKGFLQNDENYAASILNFLSVTALTNKDATKTRPWDKNEDIANTPYARSGAVVDEARAIIRLHEKAGKGIEDTVDSDKGTAAAIDLVGKNVPVKIVVEYNAYNKVAVKKFDVHFITPLKVTPGTLSALIDADIKGSFTKSSEYSYTDWNYQRVKNNPAVKWDQELWKYYAVQSIVFDVKNAKTSLQVNDNGDRSHVDGYEEGSLPAGRSLQQVKVKSGSSNKDYVWEEVQQDPTHLRYHNANGTPVNETYYIYINVASEYKWGTVNSKQKIEVKPAKGTNDPATSSRK